MNGTNVSPDATDVVSAELLDEMQTFDSLPALVRRALASANHNYSVKQQCEEYNGQKLKLLMSGSDKKQAERIAARKIVQNLNYSDYMIAKEAQLPERNSK